MTTEELQTHDGREGRKAYVAVAGTIYDVSASPLWTNGDHKGIHKAGYDLTEELKSAPHVRSVIERFPVIGALEEPRQLQKKSGLPWLLAGLVLMGLLLLVLL